MIEFPSPVQMEDTNDPEKCSMPSPGMNRPWPKIPALEVLCLALVVILMVLSWFLTYGVTRAMYDQFGVQGDPPPAMGPVGETGRNQLGHWGYFWSERAFHYRTTLMFAVDDYTSPGVLKHDTAQQYPDGVDAWREYTLLMEPVYGRLYRWFGRDGEILAEFLIRLVPLVHVLMFLPIYLLARALGVRPLLALLSVVLYATSAMGFSRFSGSLLLKEDFALFWLSLFLAAHFLAERRRSVSLLLAAAVALVFLLTSWHLAQFLVLVMLGAVALTRTPARGERGDRSLLMPGMYLLAGLLAGLTPSLAARGFHLGLTMALLVSWFVTALLGRRVGALAAAPRLRLGLLVGLFLVLGALSFLNRHYTGDYNHVFGLLYQKLVHGFRRPDDPLLLPFDVRIFWAPPFTSPSWSQAWSKLGFNLIVLIPALAGGVVLWAARRLDDRQRALLAMALVFCFGWLMIERLGVVFLPLAVVACAVTAERTGELMEERRGWPGGRSRQLVLGAVVLMLATPGANLATTLRPQVATARDVNRGRPVYVKASDQAYWGFRSDLLRWLTANTPGRFCRFGPGEPGAILGEIGISPQVLLYTGRPVVLNSQFENRPIRQRYRDYLQVLLAEDPGQLEAFLQDVQAGYLFISRDWATSDAPGSAAYMAGVKGPLTLDMNIVKLHFDPESLPFLQPVYNNEYYRVFKAGPRPGDQPLTWDRNFGNWWNIGRYTVEDGQLSDLAGDRRRLQEFEDSLVALQEAEARLRQVLAAGLRPRQPTLEELHQSYLELKLQSLGGISGQPAGPETQQQMQRLVRAIRSRLAVKDPVSGLPLGQALASLYTRGLGEGQPGWRQLLGTGLAEPAHYAAAGQLLALVGQYGEAADLLDRAAGFFPLVETVAGDGIPGPEAAPMAQRIRQMAVWYCLAADRLDEAVRKASTYIKQARPGSSQEKFYRRLVTLGTGE